MPVISDKRRWDFICGFSLEWTRWGFGVEFSFMHWTPPEIAVYLQLGPLGFRIGVEERFDWRYRDFPEVVGAPSTGGTTE